MIMESSSSLSPRSLRFISHQSFFTAVRSNDLESVKLMVNDGEGSDTAAISGLMAMQNDGGATALYVAAENNFQEVFDYLIRFCDLETVKIRNKADSDVFSVAAQHGYLGIVNKLLGLWPELCKACDVKNTSPFTAVVEELLLAGHSILNERDKKGNTAIHIATRKSRSPIVSMLLSFNTISVNVINLQQETAMDIADKLSYGPPKLAIMEALTEAGAKLARHVGRIDEEMQLKRTVSDIKHDVHSQLLQNEKTQRRVSGIAKELKKIHREAVQNTINSLTVVAVLFASIAFLAIFNLPGQYQDSGKQAGEADIARTTAFRAFCLFNATSLFISLAVVVVQITLVAWDTRAQRQIVSVVNKLMWAAGISTCGAFCSIAFVVVGKKDSWMAITMTVVGVVTVVGTLASLCYTIFQQRYGNNDSQRRIKRASGSKSFSWSYSVNISDDESDHDHEKIYAL
ncbi:putative ankyrin repeat-containing domain, PGG domain, ankyrin repeat-containing domain superfamily [Helianthus annuus]|nr:putative ankyrin repeat-containing domain, PGG domain, ankyrin repeat-containing domain superfamily [Helianthus annuus]